MIRSEQILNTVSMIQKENLDVRAVTLGINLLDCRSADIRETCAKVRAKIGYHAARLVATFGARGVIDTYLPPMLAGRWQGTMALTEPQAGSSLTDIVTCHANEPVPDRALQRTPHPTTALV